MHGETRNGLFVFDHFHQFDGAFHGGVAEEVDAEGEFGGLGIGCLEHVALQSGQASALDAYPVAYAQVGRLDRHLALSISHHQHKIFHLIGRDAGKVVSAIGILAGTVHHKVEDELGLTGDVVTFLVGAADEEVAGANHLVHPHSFACAGPLVQFALYGDV